jgi:hypothetical protein
MGEDFDFELEKLGVRSRTEPTAPSATTRP